MELDFAMLMWCIWRERNDRCFEDCGRTTVDLKAFFFKTLYLWITAFDGIHITNFLDLFVFFFSG
jgi:hypothetical protein